jgi:hypothetical protein
MQIPAPVIQQMSIIRHTIKQPKNMRGPVPSQRLSSPMILKSQQTEDAKSDSLSFREFVEALIRISCVCFSERKPPASIVECVDLLLTRHLPTAHRFAPFAVAPADSQIQVIVDTHQDLLRSGFQRLSCSHTHRPAGDGSSDIDIHTFVTFATKSNSVATTFTTARVVQVYLNSVFDASALKDWKEWSVRMSYSHFRDAITQLAIASRTLGNKNPYSQTMQRSSSFAAKVETIDVPAISEFIHMLFRRHKGSIGSNQS